MDNTDKDTLNPQDTLWVCEHGNLHESRFMVAMCRAMSDLAQQIPGAEVDCTQIVFVDDMKGESWDL